MNYGKIYNLVKNKRKFLISKDPANKTIVVDFFNVYCFIIKFNKYKTFSKETFMMTMNFLTNKFRNNNLYIVSKGVFEVSDEELLEITSKHKNLTYIICEDNSVKKGSNRERDDYGALYLINELKKKDNTEPYLVTNDKMKNFKDIITTTKPLTMHYFRDGKISNKISFTGEDIKNMKDKLTSRPSLVNFKFL